MTACAQYQRWFSPYVDEHLTRPQRAELEEHLTRCEGCRRDLVSLVQMLQTLRRMEQPEAPNLLPGIHAKLTRVSWWQRLAQRFLAPWPASLPLHGLAVATTALLVVVSLGIPRWMQSNNQQVPMRQVASTLQRERAVASHDLGGSEEVVEERKPELASAPSTSADRAARQQEAASVPTQLSSARTGEGLRRSAAVPSRGRAIAGKFDRLESEGFFALSAPLDARPLVILEGWPQAQQPASIRGLLPFEREAQADMIAFGTIGEPFVSQGRQLIHLTLDELLKGEAAYRDVFPEDIAPFFGCVRPADWPRPSERLRPGTPVVVYLRLIEGTLRILDIDERPDAETEARLRTFLAHYERFKTLLRPSEQLRSSPHAFDDPLFWALYWARQASATPEPH